MFRATKYLSLALAISFSGLASTYASAQEVSPEHLSIARKAIGATRATDAFDNILLGAANKLKNSIISTNPDLAEQVTLIVDDEAIKLAPRRGDLEGEAARLFANTFTATELDEITNFFNSPAGAKYLSSTPILARELGKSARIWAGGISRDLNTNVQKRLADAEKKVSE